jgi:hypothetical protein
LARRASSVGQAGVKRASFQVLDEFYWPGIKSDLAKYCRR